MSRKLNSLSSVSTRVLMGVATSFLFVLCLLGSLPFIAPLTGCGGGNQQTHECGTPGQPACPTNVAITINSGAQQQIQRGSAKGVQLGATVTGSSNTGASWKISSGSGATVDSTGLVKSDGTGTGTENFVVTATASADSTKSDTLDMQVVNKVLLDGEGGGQQFVNSDGSGSPQQLLASSECSDARKAAQDLSWVCYDAKAVATINIYAPTYNVDASISGAAKVKSLDLSTAALGGMTIALHPSLSPDGKWIAFVTTDKTHPADVVMKVAADGSSPATVVYVEPASSHAIGTPLWTPDGKHIMFQLDTDGTLWMIDANPTSSTKPVQLTTVYSALAFWLADSKGNLTTMYYETNDGTYKVATAANGTPSGAPTLITSKWVMGVSPLQNELLMLGAGGAVFTTDLDGTDKSSQQIGQTTTGRMSW